MRGSLHFLLLSAALWACSDLYTACAVPQLAVDVISTSSGVEILPPAREPFHADGAPGWRMADRFRGFRFVATLPATASADADDDTMAGVMALARKLRCFGWIQAYTQATLVGEARCPKAQADTLQHHLQTHSTALELKEYISTKIRFHFPTFRVLNEPKYKGKTCFPSPPHACSFESTTPPKQLETLAKDEL